MGAALVSVTHRTYACPTASVAVLAPATRTVAVTVGTAYVRAPIPGIARTTLTATSTTGTATGTTTGAAGAATAAYTVCVSALDSTSRFAPVGAVTVTPNRIEPVRAPSVMDATVTVPFSYAYAAAAPGTSVSPTYTLTAPSAATVGAGLAKASRTGAYVRPVVRVPGPIDATTALGHVYVALVPRRSTAAYVREYTFGAVPTLSVNDAVYVVSEVAVSVYATSAPVTVALVTVAPLVTSSAVSAPSDARTTDGTEALSVTRIADAEPTSAVPTGLETGPAGHTRIEPGATETAIRRRVGATMNTSSTAAVGVVVVTLNLPFATLASSAATAALDDRTSVFVGTIGLASASANVTATVVSVPATSVTPLAIVPSVAATASRAVARFPKLRVVVAPSGARSVASNCTLPCPGATVVPSVYDVTTTRAPSVEKTTADPYVAPVSSFTRTDVTCASAESTSSIDATAPCAVP